MIVAQKINLTEEEEKLHSKEPKENTLTVFLGVNSQVETEISYQQNKMEL